MTYYAICQPGTLKPILVSGFHARGDDAHAEPFTVAAIFQTKEMALNCLFNIEANRNHKPCYDIVEMDHIAGVIPRLETA